MPDDKRPSLFISDLHLSAGRPDILQRFHAFLHAHAEHAAALYILGDLFEYWIGPGTENEPTHRDIIAGLRKLGEKGISIHIMGGNRDFLIDAQFADQCGARHLPDPSVIHLHGHDILLSHGDLLCTDDQSYQRYRRVIQHPLLLGTLSRLPYGWRQRLAGSLRQASKDAMRGKTLQIMDVNDQAIRDALQGRPPFPTTPSGNPHSILIHGHTHRPGIHDYNVNGANCRRIVLGDWYTTGSYLEWDQNTYALKTFQA